VSLNKSPSVVSLFCGAGGLDIGFKEEGFALKHACDNDPAAVDCYRRNIHLAVHLRDLTTFSTRADIAAIGSCDVLLGGFPCQGFSKAGPKRKDDHRIPLYRQMINSAAVLKPRIIVAENVDGLSQNFAGNYLDTILREFADIHYRVEYRLIDAAGHGVPQHRRRIFFVGMRADVETDFRWPSPEHVVSTRNGDFKANEGPLLWDMPQPTKRALTISDAISDLVELNDQVPDHVVISDWSEASSRIMSRIKQGQKLCNVRHARASVYTWEIPEVFGPISDRQRTILFTVSRHRRHKKYGDIPNGNPLPLEEIERLTGFSDIGPDLADLLTKAYLKVVNASYDLKGAMFCSGLFKRPKWTDTAPTVLTNFDNPRYFVHPLRDRPFSIRECARLQGFPDSFTFLSPEVSKKDAYRLVGNAVPPPVSRAFARSVKDALSREA
jgi:DNA (cytosine-5)-methyltransferase 1